MPLPTESKHPQFYFSCHGVELCIALFDHDPVAWPGIVFPALMRKDGAIWTEIRRLNPLWQNDKDDIQPPLMADAIAKEFNKTIAALSGGSPVTYEQRLAAELTTRFKVVNNQLVRI